MIGGLIAAEHRRTSKGLVRDIRGEQGQYGGRTANDVEVPQEKIELDIHAIVPPSRTTKAIASPSRFDRLSTTFANR